MKKKRRDAAGGIRVGREDVKWAYWLFLDREPDDDEIARMVAAAPSIVDLRRVLLTSDEFRQKNPIDLAFTVESSIVVKEIGPGLRLFLDLSDVEIGLNVARGRYEPHEIAFMRDTVIGEGTKIDNLVQIAHNVQVGEDTVIVAQVGISGSSQVGSRVTIAGQVGVVDHVRIGDNVVVGAQAGVSKDIPEGAIVLGSPAVPHLEFKRQLAATARLPQLGKMLRALEERLRALEARLER